MSARAMVFAYHEVGVRRRRCWQAPHRAAKTISGSGVSSARARWPVAASAGAPTRKRDIATQLQTMLASSAAPIDITPVHP